MMDETELQPGRIKNDGKGQGIHDRELGSFYAVYRRNQWGPYDSTMKTSTPAPPPHPPPQKKKRKHKPKQKTPRICAGTATKFITNRNTRAQLLFYQLFFERSRSRSRRCRRLQSDGTVRLFDRFVCLGVVLTQSHLNRTEIKTPSSSKFHVNRVKILNGPGWTECLLKFFSRSKICPVPCEQSRGVVTSAAMLLGTLCHIIYVKRVPCVFTYKAVKRVPCAFTYKAVKRVPCVFTYKAVAVVAYQSSILTIPFSDSTLLWLNMSNWSGFTIVICLHDTARVRIYNR